MIDAVSQQNDSHKVINIPINNFLLLLEKCKLLTEDSATSKLDIGFEKNDLDERNILFTFFVSVEDEISLNTIVLFLFNDFNNFELVRKTKISFYR